VQTVNIRENEENQKRIIKEFSKKVREKAFLTQDEFDEVFSVFSEIVSLECKDYNIEAECERKSNRLEFLRQSVANSMPESEWVGIDVAGCDYSDNRGKDIAFFFDPVFYCKKYFGKEDVNDRLEGIVELLLTAYHEVDHSVRLVNLYRGYLSPETIETSREIFLRELYGNEFYEENYSFLSFERYADEYACSTTLEMIEDEDVLRVAEENISNKKLKRDDLVAAKLGKIKFMGGTYNKEKTIFNACTSEIKSQPKFLYSFPILGKQYREDGTLKDIHELFEEMFDDLRKIIHRHTSLDSKKELTLELQKEYFDCQMFYYEILLPQISFANEQDYRKLTEKYGVSTVQSLLSGMEKYFNSKAQEKLNYSETHTGKEFDTSEEIKQELKKNINAIIRFRNGVTFNPIAEQLLREGGFIRGTRENLPGDILKRRVMFANSLIGVYDSIESEDEYAQRAESEKMDIDEVVNALYYNRFENFLKNVEVNEQGEAELGQVEVTRTAQILKMANILSLETKQDYFEEFLRIPDVNRLMMMFEKDKNGYLNECMKTAQVRVKKVIYPPTEAEEGKYKDYILGNENSEESIDIGKKIDMLNEEIKGRNKKRSFDNSR